MVLSFKGKRAASKSIVNQSHFQAMRESYMVASNPTKSIPEWIIIKVLSKMAKQKSLSNIK